ncbi:MAG: hypothetical protein DRI69_06525, partial [Bacteroidetes bacterium]
MKYLILGLCLSIFSVSGITQQKVTLTIDGKEAFVFDSSHIDIKNNDKNTFVGASAGTKNVPDANPVVTAGRQNTFIGSFAGFSHLNGSSNTFLGASAGQSTTSGIQNTFIGHLAGFRNVTGYRNAYLGRGAGYNGENGNGNTYVGYNTSGTVDGDDNTVVGYGAGKSKHQSENTFIGTGAGSSNLGYGNVMIGNLAGSNDTLGNNKLYIDNYAAGTPLIYGEFFNQILRINGELQIGSAYKFPIIAGTNSQILKTNGAGQISWQDDNINDADSNPSNELQSLSIVDDSLFISNGNGVKIPVPVVTMMSDADNDTKIELFEGPTDGVQITVDNTLIMGVDARSIQFFNNNGNTFVGERTGANNSGAGSNTFIGKEAGKVNSSGYSNTFVGNSAGLANTIGIQNTYLGTGAGLFNVLDSGNVFIGYQSGFAAAGSNKLCIDNSTTPH